MSAMTHLDRRFLWHQFKAGPWMRFLIALVIPSFALFTTDGVWWKSFFVSFIWVIMLSTIAIPEPGVFKALGMNRARICQQVLTLVLPIAILVVAVLYLLNSQGSVLSSAIGSVLAGVTFLASSLPWSDTPDYGRTGGISLARRKGSFAFEIFWRRMCVWGLPAGVLTGILYAVCAGSASSWVTGVLPAAAPLFYWAWAVGSGLPSVATAQSFGITRKSWVVTSVSVVAVASVLVTGSALLVALLIDASVPVVPLLLHGVIGFSVILLAKAMETWMPSLVFFIVILAWSSTRQIMDVAGGQAGVGSDTMQVVLVFCGLCLLSAAVGFALMLTGRLDPKRQREVRQ